MLFHDIGKDIAVFRLGKLFYGSQAGEGLETEFGQEAETELAVFRKRLVPVPYIPVMCISAVFVTRIVETAAGRRA